MSLAATRRPLLPLLGTERVGRFKGSMPSFMGIVARSKSEEGLGVSKVSNTIKLDHRGCLVRILLLSC
jgi:hypothetical protein